MSTEEIDTVIDLSRVRTILAEAQALVDELDGVDLDETDSITEKKGGPAKQRARQERARKSTALNLLASRFELAASLTKVEYFYARGETDPTRPERNN